MNEPTPQPVREGIMPIPMPGVSFAPNAVAGVVFLILLLVLAGCIIIGNLFFNVPIRYVFGVLLIAIFCACTLAWSLVRLLRYRSQWRRLLAALPADDPNRPVMEGLEATGAMLVWSSLSLLPIYETALAERLAESGRPVPRTIIPESMREELLAIPRPDDLLEPERIASSTRTGRVAFVLILIAAVTVVGTALMNRDWMRAGFYSLLCGVILWNSSGLSHFTRAYRNEDNLPTAWPGGISDHTGRRWTVRDSVMVVRGARPGGGLAVEVLGGAMNLQLTFASSRDPDFITLWQRWNHPQPRPELV